MPNLYPLTLRIFFFSTLLILNCISRTKAQMLVSTVPGNKNFLIEKGTGHTCTSCPGIERKCDSVLAAHQCRGMLIEYHFGPDALPQAPPLDYDFTTPYGDTISDPNKLNWPFYLNMMVNRRDQGSPYHSVFIFGQDNQVQHEADTLVKQPSPVNLYLSSIFDNNSRLLTITAQAYYTAASETSTNYLQIALTQDSIISTQFDFDIPSTSHENDLFVFMNVFRDNLNGFGGDTINSTVAGRFVSRTYNYTVPESFKNIPCDPKHCNLTMYIAEQKADSGNQSFTGKVINSIRSKVGNGVTTAIAAPNTVPSILIYPNPTSGTVSIGGLDMGNYKVEVRDITGNVIRDIKGNDNKQQLLINLESERNGIYFIKVITSNYSRSYPIVLSK